MPTKLRPPARLREAVEIAESVGWTYDITGRSHPRLTPPAGLRRADGTLQPPLTFPSTPSDWRSDLNALAALRRAGVPLRPVPPYTVVPHGARFAVADADGELITNRGGFVRAFRSRDNAEQLCKRLCAEHARGQGLTNER